jgi:hypothetical protein
VRHFADSSQFYIPDEHHEPLTSERAYMQLKTLIEREFDELKTSNKES